MLVLRGKTGVIAMVKAGDRRHFFIETESEEIVLGVEPEDLVVASCLNLERAGSSLDRIIKGLGCVLYLIREMGSPLIVLPKKHPASHRLPIVVSAGERTKISCKITPGTHPEQDILCGSEEFDGIEITGVKGGVEFKNLTGGAIERRKFLP